MNSLWNSTYIVVDVETTGSHAERNRLMEIGCVEVSGGEVVGRYGSLINPHQFIPQFIANMTGITNEAAFNAPEARKALREAAPYLYKEGAVFVAHNVGFDYGFVKASFEREGLPFPDMPKLCTLKLARRLLPKGMKKNVGALAAYFGIKIKNRHRALGDAEATAQILLELLEIAEREHGLTTLEELLAFQSKETTKYYSAPPAKDRVSAKLQELPDSPGVYYFYGRTKRVIYVGKAKSLRDRVSSYFRPGSLTSRKMVELVGDICDVNWENTGSELEALILESREIKRLTPRYNTLAKRYRHFPFIKISRDNDFPFVEKCYDIEDDGAEYFGPFRNSYTAEELVETINKNFRLRKCEKDLKPSKKINPCIYYEMNKCLAPCAGLATRDDYEEELNAARKYLSGFSEGIIKGLEAKMTEAADALNFELAATFKQSIYELRKIFARKKEVSTSINDNNLIALLTNCERERTIDLYMIKEGKLIRHETVGSRAPLKNALGAIKSIYFNGLTLKKMSLEDIDEVKIVSSWLYRNKELSKIIYLSAKSESDIIDEFTKEVRNFDFSQAAPAVTE